MATVKLAFTEEFLDPSATVKGFLFNMPFTTCKLTSKQDKTLVATIPASELCDWEQEVIVPDTATIKNGLLVWYEENLERNIKQTIAIKF